MFILGLDAPTMNEYIDSNKIGKFIKLNETENIKLSLNEIIQIKKIKILIQKNIIFIKIKY